MGLYSFLGPLCSDRYKINKPKLWEKLFKDPLLTVTLCALNETQDKGNLGQKGLSDNMGLKETHYFSHRNLSRLYFIFTSVLYHIRDNKDRVHYTIASVALVPTSISKRLANADRRISLNQ